MNRLILFAVLSLLAATTAVALPEFAVESARDCATCHVKPDYWDNPDVSERKCSLHCTACHVNPSGGGMRHEGGQFYGRNYLKVLDINSTGVGPAPGDPPGPMDPARFGGIRPSPTVQVGVDLRSLAYFPQAEGEESSYFPMQTDIQLAIRPYNPREHNRGRVTLMAVGGAEGNREDEGFDDATDRLFWRELWALVHDLPNQAYLKLGRFTPEFGWKLDDHTAFVRQEQSFDAERQVTGVELGMNPNYLYASASVFANERAGEAPVPEGGYGGAFSIGWRDLAWQLGSSVMFEDRDEASDLWAGVTWAINLFRASHPWKGLNVAPLVYLGEFDVRRTDFDEGGIKDATGLTAFHQLVYFPDPAWRVLARYDWQDPDLDLLDDHRSRVTLGIVSHPVSFLEIAAHARYNFEPADIDDDEYLIMTHIWY